MKRIVTISRQYGSGGREVGRLVAGELGYAFYDKELIRLVAEQSGFALGFVEETGEYAAHSVVFNPSIRGFAIGALAGEINLSLPDSVFVLQSRIIREIADREPCVIVGRSAEYILKEREDCLSVFVHAPPARRVERVITQYGVPEKEAEKSVRKKDKNRAAHYRHYTDQVWGMAENYHMSVDSSIFGVQGCRDIIVGAVHKI